ncbi:hypothetical protein CN279_05320 [Bacillus anthracis]|nr:hypothetical protein CN415_25290 [Bacillus cereus]PFE28638.1 hypothetical protein CN279_05320 [Bacillus anthracis]
MGDFPDISAQLELYRRFSKYISATGIISAIFRIYRLTDKNRQYKKEAVPIWNSPFILCK